MSLDKKNTIKKQKNKESDIENQTRTMDALRGQGHLRKFMPLYLNWILVRTNLSILN